VHNGSGGPGGSSGKAVVGLKRTETVGKFNDDQAEKRLWRKSAKLLGQQTTMFDSLTDQGPGVAELNTGQLNSVVPAAPIINVPRDVMNSDFEEWMKMATDNVSFSYLIRPFPVRRDPLTQLTRPYFSLVSLENQREQLMELCPNRLFSRHVPTAKQHRQLDQLPTSLL
jgi:hypothetical protein